MRESCAAGMVNPACGLAAAESLADGFGALLEQAASSASAALAALRTFLI
jgi:hypothetical protein